MNEGDAMANEKIIIVDDDPSVQQVVRAYLERDGYLMYVAGTVGGSGARRTGPTGADRPGPDAARPPRRGRLPRDPWPVGRARAADGQGRGGRPGGRPRAGRRRLPDQAALAAGPGRPGPGRATPHARRGAA